MNTFIKLKINKLTKSLQLFMVYEDQYEIRKSATYSTELLTTNIFGTQVQYNKKTEAN
jgi:hypothetical protein